MGVCEEKGSCKGAAVQEGLERGSFFSTVRSRYQGTASENTGGRKVLKPVK